MKRFIIILALLSLSCGQITTAAMVDTGKPTPETLATVQTLATPTHETLATPTPTDAPTVHIVGKYHLRAEPRAGGVTVVHVYNEKVTVIKIDKVTGWYQVETVGGKVGWVSPLAIGE